MENEPVFHMAPGQFYSKQPAIPSATPSATPSASSHTLSRVSTKTRSRCTNNILTSMSLDQTFCGNMPQRCRELYVDHHIDTCDSMYSTSMYGHHGCVNALAFSRDGEKLLATGGDDKRVLVWTVANAIQGHKNMEPVAMATEHGSNIFTIDFSCDNSFIFSGGGDSELIKHDLKTRQFLNSYEHLEAVYSVATHPSSPEVVFTASEDGCVYIIDTRISRRELGHDMLLCEQLDSYQCVAINPVEPQLVAVSNAQCGSSLYDTRNRKQMVAYKGTSSTVFSEDGVSVCFNSTGTQVFSMYRRHAPTLHNLWDSSALCYYSDIGGAYRNSVTMKSGCFMGQNDELVVSGSDDFRIYIWKVPREPNELNVDSGAVSATGTIQQQCNPHLILPGHRSIVNQTRFSKINRILVSSGVEKLIKVWSDLPLNGENVVHKSRDPPSRTRYTSAELNTMMRSSDPIEPTDPSQEDPKVLALFDSLVEQDSSDSDNEDGMGMLFPILRELPFFGDSSRYDSTPDLSDLSPANSSSIDMPWEDDELEDDELEDDELEDYRIDFNGHVGSRLDDLFSDSEDESSDDFEAEVWRERRRRYYGRVWGVEEGDDEQDNNNGEVNHESENSELGNHDKDVRRVEISNGAAADKSVEIINNDTENLEKLLLCDEADASKDKNEPLQSNGSCLVEACGESRVEETRSIGPCASDGGNNNCVGNDAEASDTDESCYKSKTKRQRLMERHANDYSQYSLEDFLKTKPPNNFYSRSSSNGNSSKQ